MKICVNKKHKLKVYIFYIWQLIFLYIKNTLNKITSIIIINNLTIIRARAVKFFS